MGKRLSRQEAANYLQERSGKRHTRGMLEQKASRKSRPKYEIVDGHASYTTDDLDAYLETVTETPEVLLEAVMAGRLPIGQGLQCIEACRKATETIVHAELSLEDARLEAAPPPAPAQRDPTAPSRARPAWLRPAAGKTNDAA